MNQSTLAAFSDHLREPTKKLAAFDCHNCHNQRGFRGSQVLCLGRLKDLPEGGCGSWTDGIDRWPDLARNYETPKKWRGEA